MSEQLLLPYFYKGAIYLIENIQDHKKYIGQTGNENPEEYILDHFKNAINNVDLKGSKKGKYLYNAIRKYGVQNFTWRILGEIYSDNLEDFNKQLNQAEIDCIFHFRTFGADGEQEDNIYGYNRTKGISPWTKGLTKETDERIKVMAENVSKALKGKKQSQEHCRNNGLSHKGLLCGSKNPSAKKYLIISPEGKEYIVYGEFKPFCKKHNLCYAVLRKVAIGKLDNYKGWKCYYV